MNIRFIESDAMTQGDMLEQFRLIQRLKSLRAQIRYMRRRGGAYQYLALCASKANADLADIAARYAQ